MKKYMVSIALLVTVVASSCSLLGPSVPLTQVKPQAPRAYVWDIPQTENMLFKNILPEATNIILAYDNKGNAMYVVVSNKMYGYLNEQLQAAKKMYTGNELSAGIFFGLDLGVSPIGKISLLTREQIKSLTTPEERNLAVALNDFEKYTLFGESTRPVIGGRSMDGKFIPSFSSTVSIENRIDGNQSLEKFDSAKPKNAWEEAIQKKRGN